jgi:hypothetical protein
MDGRKREIREKLLRVPKAWRQRREKGDLARIIRHRNRPKKGVEVAISAAWRTQ